MPEQEKMDSQIATAEKIARELSPDELEAISGGTCCRDTYNDPDPPPPKSCDAIQRGARRYVCSKYII